MKYVVTYGYMDMDAGANPLGHSFILLSKQTSDDSPIEVVNSYGFYSQPNSSKNPLWRNLKQTLGFKFDFRNVHGTLKQEILRHVDVNGLHGVNFVTTEDKFNNLITICNKRIGDEKNTIDELNELLTQEGSDINGRTRLEKEQALATQQNRNMRLDKFHVSLSFTRNGLDTRSSNTCKWAILNILEQAEILDRITLRKLMGGPSDVAFPRYSNIPFQPIRLVSTGSPAEVYESKKGTVFFNRVWGKNPLYWATPIHIDTESLSDTARKELDKIYLALKNVLTRAYKVENDLRQKLWKLQANDPKPTQDIARLSYQLENINQLYCEFIHQHDNDTLEKLTDRLQKANTTLNLATIALDPKQVNYSFLLRACLSTSMRHALLGTLCLCCAALFIPGIFAISVVAASSVYTGYKLTRFFKEESQTSMLRKTYQQYGQMQPEPSHLPSTPMENLESIAAP